MSIKKVIVSACLAGVDCRFDCKSNPRQKIIDMVASGEAVPVCPEQLGGLSTPRPAAEIVGDRVITNQGVDVTPQFKKGAEEAFKIAQLVGASEAYLKARSPSCGCGQVYDGSYTHKLKAGDGIFTQLLKKKGIKIHSID